MFLPSSTSSRYNSYDQTLLGEQLDWLTVDHDDLRQDLLEKTATPKYHPSMATIDKWEKETIARIQHTAILARRTLLDALDKHVHEVKNTLNTLTPQLRDARDGTKPFNGRDIKEWATILNELKQIPTFPVIRDKKNKIYGISIKLQKEEQTPPSVSNRHDRNSPLLTSNATEYQGPSSNTLKRTDKDNKKVDTGNTLSNESHTITPRGPAIVREPPRNETTITPRYSRLPHAEIPFDSRANYPLRGPPTIYR
jgi:hypothetical protein